jgi:hypothetical protein
MGHKIRTGKGVLRVAEQAFICLTWKGLGHANWQLGCLLCQHGISKSCGTVYLRYIYLSLKAAVF